MRNERFWIVATMFGAAKWGKFKTRIDAEAKAREVGVGYVASCGIDEWQGSRTYRVRPVEAKS